MSGLGIPHREETNGGSEHRNGSSHQTEEVGLLTEILLAVRNIIVAYCVAVFRFFVPPPRKAVAGEVVLITGSGRGIGRRLSLEFAELGAVVVLWDIDEESNRETQRMVQENRGKGYCYTCDISDRFDVYRTAEKVKKEVGVVTILINNAGVVTGKKLLDCPDEMIERTFKVNLLAQFWTVKCFLPDMLKSNHGHIVNMASSIGLIGINKLTDYAASKFGVVGFTEVLNYEIVFSGYDGVHTSVVCPSFTMTGMFEGCKMKFPRIVAPLTTEETVSAMMQGILTNQYQVCVPKSVYLFSILKTFIPVDGMLEIIQFFGAHNFMDSFVGHKDEKEEERRERLTKIDE